MRIHLVNISDVDVTLGAPFNQTLVKRGGENVYNVEPTADQLSALTDLILSGKIQAPQGIPGVVASGLLRCANGAEPPSPSVGTTVFSTTDNAPRTWNGSQWVTQGRDSWAQIGDMASPHGSAEIVPLSGNSALVIMGGAEITPEDPEADISDVCESLVTRQLTWAPAATVPTPLTASFGVDLRGGKSVIVGGGVPGFGPDPLQLQYNNKSWTLEPSGWVPRGNLPAAWAAGPVGENRPAVRLANGKILIAGGFREDEQTQPGKKGTDGTIADLGNNVFSFTKTGGPAFVAGDIGKQFALYSGTDPNDGLNFIANVISADVLHFYSGNFFQVPGAFVGPWLINLVVATKKMALYDPGPKTWAPTGDMTVARLDHTMTLLKSGKVLITGGKSVLDFPGNAYLARLESAEVYDPATGISTAIADPMPIIPEEDPFIGPYAAFNGARSQHAAELLPSGRVLIGGGLIDFGPELGNFGLTRTAFLFDESLLPASPWITNGDTLNAPTGRARANMARLPDGRVLMFGGLGFPFGQELVECEIFDEHTESWTPAAEMPARAEVDGVPFGLVPCSSNFPHAVLSDGRVLAAGGDTFSVGGGSFGVPWSSQVGAIYTPGTPSTPRAPTPLPPVSAAQAKKNLKKGIGKKPMGWV